ncbi:MAG: hypothetical protein ACHQZQ_06660 [SAR324 cluster bacterium]
MNRTFQTISFLPVIHGRMEFAAVVRQALLAGAPDVLAVELPATWREPLLQAVNRLPFLSLILDEQADEHRFLPIEPTEPLVEGLRTARELGIPVELIDLDVEGYPLHHEPAPDSHAVSRLGYEPYLDAYYANAALPESASDAQREVMMAHALQRLAGTGQRVTCVLGAAHLPGVIERLATPQPRPLARAKARPLRLCNWAQQSSREFMTEPPFLAAAYERWRSAPAGTPAPDREALSEALVADAAQRHADAFAETLTPSQRRMMGVFAKKYALVEGMLVPDLFQLVVAARGVVDDEFGFELWESGSDYPWQDGSGMLPTVDLQETFAWLDGRRLTLRRKLRRQRPRLRDFAHKQRLKEQFGGKWKSQWSGRFICSHPPEDLIVEEFGRYLKHKAQGQLTSEHTRVEPFLAALKDGVDVRETLRHWHERTLYVRDVRPVSGRFGSVVVIFDDDRPPRRAGTAGGAAQPQAEPAVERYPWRVTWLGEHEQESDMALYATPAGDDVIGPGISRCEYGGFLLSYPPLRLTDVWSDPYFEPARSKAERLLMAGLDYSVEKQVLYVAATPPRSWFRGWAERLGRKLVYLPVGQLSPGTLKKIRTFHVLDGQHVREYADQYIRRK